MIMPTGRTPTAKGARRREAILGAAADSFARRGYEQTSMQDLADSAGILKGSLYYYFASKEAVLFHVLLRNHAGLSQYVVDDVDYDGLAGLEAVRTFIERHVDYVLRNAETSGLYAQESGTVRSVEEWWATLAAARRRHESFLIDLVTRAQNAGQAAPDDPVLTARALLSMANATYRWHAGSSHYDRETVAAHHARLAVRALRRQLPERN